MKKTNFSRLLSAAIIFAFLGTSNYASAQCYCTTDLFPLSFGVTPGSTTANLFNSGTTNAPSYNWYRDGNFVQACACASLNTAKPGEYMLRSNCSLKEYSNFSNVYINVPASPAPSTTANLNSVTTGATGVVYYLTSDVDFSSIGSGSLTFTNCTFIFQSGVKMGIPEFYASLIPLDVDFVNCGFYGEPGAEWDGVDIIGGGGGGDITFTECHFRDANFAIHLDGDRALTVDDCEFGKNGVHVALENVSVSTPSSNVITNNQFGNLWKDATTYSSDHPYNLSSTRLYTHVWLSNCDGIVFNQNTHVETKIDAGGYNAYGIYADGCNAIGIQNTTIDGSLKHGIHFNSGNTDCTIASSDFNYSPMYIKGSSGPCSDQKFELFNGIYSYSSDNLTINNNNFRGCIYGTEIYSGNSTNIVFLTKNKYDENAYGLVLASDVNPIISSTGNSNTITQNTTFYCNIFTGNYKCGVVGWGTVIAQGQSGSGPEADASNKFTSNIEWHLLIDHGGAMGTPMDYYFNQTGVTTGNYDYSFNPTTNGANVTLYGNGSPSTTVNLQTSDENMSTGCYPTLKKGWNTTSVDDIKTDQDNSIIVYPNPFSNSIIINLSEGAANTYSIILTDVTGKVVSESSVTAQEEFVIGTAELATGVYFVRVLDENNNLTHYQKLIKVQ